MDKTSLPEGESGLKKLRLFFVQAVKSVLAALVFVMLLKGSVVEATQIFGASMTPTLIEGDYIFVNKFKYGLHLPFVEKMALLWSEPRRGDVITFFIPENLKNRKNRIYIKRIVAVAGDKVEIIRSRLYINDRLVESSLVKGLGFIYSESLDDKKYNVMKKNPHSSFKTFVVPKGHVFAIGDNRDNSYDSRNWGPVPVENIKGKAIVIYFTRSITDSLENLKRIGGFL